MGSSHQQSLPFSLKRFAIWDTVCLQGSKNNRMLKSVTALENKTKCARWCACFFLINARLLSLLVDESLSALSVVEDGDRDAPASLSGDAPVRPSVQHAEQAAPGRLGQNAHLLQGLLQKHMLDKNWKC